MAIEDYPFSQAFDQLLMKIVPPLSAVSLIAF
jgi:hypothetical protein